MLTDYDDKRFVAIEINGSGNIASDYRGRETLMIFDGRDQGGRSAKINHYAGPYKTLCRTFAIFYVILRSGK